MMKLALHPDMPGSADDRPAKKFYPFKQFDPYRDFLQTKATQADTSYEASRFFENSKAIQVGAPLEEVVPGNNSLNLGRDHGVTTFHHILSHYDKDMTLRPDQNEIQFLESLPNRLAVYTMLGLGKTYDPASFEMVTHDKTRRAVAETGFTLPVSKDSVTLNILEDNAGIRRKKKGSLDQDLFQLPHDPFCYPGKNELDHGGDLPEEQATKIQKIFRGNLSRAKRVDLTNEVKRLEALQKYYDPYKYSDPINKLRQFTVKDKDLKQEKDKKELKKRVQTREHFCGMNLEELLVTANRDPFTNQTIKKEARHSQSDLTIDRLRHSEIQHGLKLDELRWDVEESKIFPEYHDYRRDVTGKGAKQRQDQAKSTISNTDLGYSDEIEFNIQNTGQSESFIRGSSIDNESIIEDIAHSRSLSRSRSRRGAKKNKNYRQSSSKDDFSVEKESSGFGFINDVKKPVTQKDPKLRLTAEAEESESNSFGFLQNKPLSPRIKTDKLDENAIQDSNKSEIRASSSSINQEQKAGKGQFATDFVKKDKRPLSAWMDKDIYAPVVEVNPYKENKKEIYKSGSSTSKAIEKKLTEIYAELNHNKQILADIKPTTRIESADLARDKQKDQTIIDENEKLLKKLRNKVSLAKEEIMNPTQIEGLLKDLLLTRQSQEFQASSNPQAESFKANKLPGYNLDEFSFDQLFAKAVLSPEYLARMDQHRYEETVRRLESRIERLDQAEINLEDAIDLHKRQIEQSQEATMKRFNKALEARRQERDRILAKMSKGVIPSKAVGITHQTIPEKAAPLSLNLAGKGRQSWGKRSSMKSPLITEESLESGTLVSDYSESREQLESISWVEASAVNQKKQVNIN